MLPCQTEIIEAMGYPTEIHHVTTSDGYILELHRIPHGINGSSEDRPVALLQHCFLCSSADYVMNTPDEALGECMQWQKSRRGSDGWVRNTDKLMWTVFCFCGSSQCLTLLLFSPIPLPHPIAYVLADAGYDVWMPNFRGNTYSRNHVELDPANVKFWNWRYAIWIVVWDKWWMKERATRVGRDV